MKQDEDPTKIKLETKLRPGADPTIQRMQGVAYHGNTPFDVPFISHIEGNLWQGGCTSGLELPFFFKHVVSLYPWESYKVNHSVDSTMSVRMYDDIAQSTEQVDAIAAWVNECKKTGPVLVHCQAGLNRSSLIAARSLMLEGRTANEAIALLRERRSPAVLCNRSFEAHLKLKEELDRLDN